MDIILAVLFFAFLVVRFLAGVDARRRQQEKAESEILDRFFKL